MVAIELTLLRRCGCLGMRSEDIIQETPWKNVELTLRTFCAD